MKREKIIFIFELIMLMFFCNILKVNADSYTKLNKYKATIGIGYSTVLTASDSEGNTITDGIWKSSNTNVAKVSKGIVTGISPGTSLISVTTSYGVATCKVTIIENYVPVTSLKIETKNIKLIAGNTKKISYQILPNDATNKDVTFTSENPKIATVDSSGTVKGISDGTTKIKVDCENYSGEVTVSVTTTISLKSISLEETIEIDELSEKQLVLTYNPSNATNKKVTWKSSNEEIATVDENGKVTAKKSGEVNISATSSDGGYTATTKVKIKEISKAVTEIKLNKEEVKLEKGQEETLSVTFTPEYATNKKVTWESSNSKIVTVDEDGKITGIKAGNATITATSDDGDFKATCKVTISSAPIESIKFSQESQTIYIGDSSILETIATPEDSAIENAIWKSSDEEVATVTEDGTVSGLKLGTTTITISNQDGTITASTEVEVIEKPAEAFNVTIEGYDLNFSPKTLKYTLKIKKEDSLKITTNYEDNVVISGNENLQNGSLITITYKQKNLAKKEYSIVIEKDKDYTILFIIIISILLLINIIRVLIKSKNKKKKR